MLGRQTPTEHWTLCRPLCAVFPRNGTWKHPEPTLTLLAAVTVSTSVVFAGIHLRAACVGVETGDPNDPEDCLASRASDLDSHPPLFWTPRHLPAAFSGSSHLLSPTDPGF